MKHCVIHTERTVLSPKKIARDLYRNPVFENMDRLIDVMLARIIIDNVFKYEDPIDVFHYERKEPSWVADYYEPGDDVTLYGAYITTCLDTAKEALEEKGVNVYLHPDGCIGL